MDQSVPGYVAAIAPAHRPLFDRLHRLIVEVCPAVTVDMSYRMPTYRVGGRRMYLGVWRHGVSIYGWNRDADGGFLARHPELAHGRGTIRLRPEAAEAVTDDELRALVRGTLTGAAPAVDG